MKVFRSVLIMILVSAFPYISFCQDEGIDTLATINSFEAAGEFYTMDYSGDYSDLLDMIDDQFTGEGSEAFDSFECSLFTAQGDEDLQFLGRNFDNPDNDVLFTRYSPPDGYQSMAFTRMNDLGYAYGTNFEDLTFAQKIPLLRSAYFVPDGINEHGLTAGLASVDPVQTDIDPEKDTIFITRLIREILDHAQSVDEAIDVANSFNVFDNGIHVISHHLLVGTPDGESVVLEYHNGAFQTVQTSEDWQVLTNIPVWNVEHELLMNTCWRYNSLYDDMEDAAGILSWDEGMIALEAVHMNCPWSAIYNMSDPSVYIAIMNNYDDIAYIDLADFEASIYVGVDKAHQEAEVFMLNNFPNPFTTSTHISFVNPATSHLELCIYDQSGAKVRTLINGVLQEGEHTCFWDAKDDTGLKLRSGVYYYTVKCDAGSQTTKLILLAN